MAKAEDYRQLAGECLRTAELVTDPTAKASMLAMAREWYSLADKSECDSRADEMPPQSEAQQPVAQQQQIQPGERDKPET